MLRTQLQEYGLISRSQQHWNSCWATAWCKESQDWSSLDRRGSRGLSKKDNLYKSLKKKIKNVDLALGDK